MSYTSSTFSAHSYVKASSLECHADLRAAVSSQSRNRSTSRSSLRHYIKLPANESRHNSIVTSAHSRYSALPFTMPPQRRPYLSRPSQAADKMSTSYFHTHPIPKPLPRAKKLSAKKRFQQSLRPSGTDLAVLTKRGFKIISGQEMIRRTAELTRPRQAPPAKVVKSEDSSGHSK